MAELQWIASSSIHREIWNQPNLYSLAKLTILISIGFMQRNHVNPKVRLCAAIAALGIFAGAPDVRADCNIEESCQLEFTGTVPPWGPAATVGDELVVLFSWERSELLHRADVELITENYFLHNTTVEVRNGSDVTTISGPGYAAEGIFGAGTNALYFTNDDVYFSLVGFNEEAETSINGLLQTLTDETTFSEGGFRLKKPIGSGTPMTVASIRVVPEPSFHLAVFCFVGFLLPRRR
ncbi:hypothetical protein ACFL2H_00025 [Planctomycetota bacterium]